MSSAQALTGAPLTGVAPRLTPVESGRPEIVRETGHAHGATVVEKPCRSPSGSTTKPGCARS